MIEIEHSCFGCAHLKVNSVIKMPADDGYDCAACSQRVLDFYMLKNKSSDAAMKKLYPPYGIPEFCPIIKDFTINVKEEMEYV